MKRFGSDVKIVHFIGRKKPWQYTVNLETGQVTHDHDIMSITSAERFIQQWWDIYNEIAAQRITVRHFFYVNCSLVLRIRWKKPCTTSLNRPVQKYFASL